MTATAGPSSPTAILTRPNGYDDQARRLSFACFKQCTRSAHPEHLELYRHCPHRANSVGFATHVAVTKLPRLILEIPRGSDRFKQLHKLRSAAERTNSTLQSDLAILDQPAVMSISAAAASTRLLWNNGVLITGHGRKE